MEIIKCPECGNEMKWGVVYECREEDIVQFGIKERENLNSMYKKNEMETI